MTKSKFFGEKARVEPKLDKPCKRAPPLPRFFKKDTEKVTKVLPKFFRGKRKAASLTVSQGTGQQLLETSKEACSICLSEALEERTRPDSCQHFFCWTCIDSWAGHSTLCPLCKVPFASIVGPALTKAISPKKARTPDDGDFGDWEDEESYDGEEGEEGDVDEEMGVPLGLHGGRGLFHPLSAPVDGVDARGLYGYDSDDGFIVDDQDDSDEDDEEDEDGADEVAEFDFARFRERGS